MADKGYKKMVTEQAKALLETVTSEFDGDSEEHGGGTDSPNFAKWLDRTGKLNTHVETLSNDWGRADIEMINSNSRNSVSYGDPKGSARFALLKDVLHEVKKLKKQGA